MIVIYWISYLSQAYRYIYPPQNNSKERKYQQSEAYYLLACMEQHVAHGKRIHYVFRMEAALEWRKSLDKTQVSLSKNSSDSLQIWL